MGGWLKRNSWKFLIPIIAWMLLASSCFQFRTSDKQQIKTLAKYGVQAELGVREVAPYTIHYSYLNSDTTKPLIVFIHGSPGSSSSFLHYMYDTSLTNKCDVLLIDRPGFGYSNFGTSEPSLEKQGNALAEVVRSFERRRVILVGHSLGGPIVSRMMMDDTLLASAMVIIAGSIAAEFEPNEKWRKPMDKKAFRWLLPTAFRVSNQEIIPAYDELKRMEGGWINITVPVTIIQGGKDNLVPEGNAHYGEKVLVNSTQVKKIILPDKNHFIPFEDQALVIKEIKNLARILD